MQSKPDGSEVYIFADDDTDEAAIQTVIDAHDPKVLSIGELKEANKSDARSRFLMSQLANKSPAQIYSHMQSKIDSWPNIPPEIKADLREWLPLLAALMAMDIQEE